jgi:hypothetical protein
MLFEELHDFCVANDLVLELGDIVAFVIEHQQLRRDPVGF